MKAHETEASLPRNLLPALKSRPVLNRIIRNRYLYLMLLPGLASIMIFNYIPIFGWWMAFTDYQVGKSIWQAPWVGLRFFKEFFSDSNGALPVIRNTLIMNVSSLIVGLGVAFLFAILLKEVRLRWFQKTVQYATFLPYFMSWVILYAVVYSLFSVNSGAMNETLVRLGWLKEPLNILGDKQYSWLLIVTVNTWNSLGYNSVIFIAAIAGIPSELYEAAEIDGAGRIQKIVFITAPSLLPTLVVLVIMNAGWLLNSGLDQFFIFTNSLNMETMEVFDYYIYRFGLKQFNYSYATAVSIVKTLVSLGLLILVNRWSRRSVNQSIF
ncbi:MAG: ABC transporter permease subunit [Eubacteriales bacterium]|nr:ABC transporter permease subunit [Eubacteriales bacterium]